MTYMSVTKGQIVYSLLHIPIIVVRDKLFGFREKIKDSSRMHSIRRLRLHEQVVGGMRAR